MLEKTISIFELPDEADSLRLGMQVIAAGVSKVPPSTTGPENTHPHEHAFSCENGRVLNEYQLIYISSGHGVFESARTGEIRVEAGQVILLFPGIWHQYNPSTESGWCEHWIAFSGDRVRRIMLEYFTPSRPVIHVGEDHNLLNLISSTIDLMQKAPEGYQHRMAARVMESLAIIESRCPMPDNKKSELSDKIEKARLYFLEHFEQAIEIRGVASQVGMSIPLFRRDFKSHTGKAPKQYLIDIRINKARELLRDTKLSVSEIAKKTGSTSINSFSGLFKKNEGCSPMAYRQSFEYRTH